MGFRCGIVGLPNVGKSTLFNALTSTANAAADNYPFCTIEPNVARVPVPSKCRKLRLVNRSCVFREGLNEGGKLGRVGTIDIGAEREGTDPR